MTTPRDRLNFKYMIISVLGHVIDTKNIYVITPVYGGISKGEAYHSFSNPWFNVTLFNGKKITFEYPAEDVDKDRVAYWEKVTRETKILQENLIKLWQQDQSDLPKLEFGKPVETTKEQPLPSTEQIIKWIEEHRKKAGNNNHFCLCSLGKPFYIANHCECGG